MKRQHGCWATYWSYGAIELPTGHAAVAAVAAEELKETGAWPGVFLTGCARPVQLLKAEEQVSQVDLDAPYLPTGAPVGPGHTELPSVLTLVGASSHHAALYPAHRGTARASSSGAPLLLAARKRSALVAGQRHAGHKHAAAKRAKVNRKLA